jgi:beta-glucosidase
MSVNSDAEKIIAELSVEEKVALLSGAGDFHSLGIDRVGLPEFFMSDGPHGLRKQEQDNGLENASSAIKAVCFPAACATACSFDKELLFELGEALGDECQAENIALLLGPGANIKRSPLCGRNFEYFSEDPYLTSCLAAAFIQGIESKGPGACLKHFAVNNQETCRMSVSANVDERTLRELYLAAFEDAVKAGKPAAVMCSYNRVNGVYVSENQFLLTAVLQEEWAYEGLVVSDWGAVNNRVQSLAAGLHLEMPGSHGRGAAKLLDAFQCGELDEKTIDRAAVKIAAIALHWKQQYHGKPYDKEAHHRLAAKIESESIVLLKNTSHVLPLQKDENIVFIGEFAEKPRFQGGGSSRINGNKIVSALEAAGRLTNVRYIKGFGVYDDTLDEKLIEEAVNAALKADKVVVFAGLSDAVESEGFDREDMELPSNQNRLIELVAEVQNNIIVVLHNGSPVSMPWLEKVPGLVEAWLGGQAIGEAVVDVLFGNVNPSGKLAETFPLKVEDNPAFLNFPGSPEHVDYHEGFFIGYRYYDKKKMNVAFPFGYGLSYTTFSYLGMTLSAETIRDTEQLTITVTIKNTGKMKGKEIIQLYVAGRKAYSSPEKELKGFEKIELAPGRTGEVAFILDKRSFANWDTERHVWRVFGEYFVVYSGPHSRHLPLRAEVQVVTTEIYKQKYHINSTLGEVLRHPLAKEIILPRIETFIAKTVTSQNEFEDLANRGVNRTMINKMLASMPLRGLISATGGRMSEAVMSDLIQKMNEE